MKLQFKKSGRVRKQRKSLATRWHEMLDQIGKHFASRFVGRLQNAREVRLWVVEWALLVLVVLLFAVVQIFWYSDAYETEAYVAGGDYSEATLGKVNSMNPLYAATSSEKTLAKLLFANVASPDTSGHMKGELAKSVTMDETGKVWTVTLRDEIYWSDNEPITADDLMYTVKLIADPTAKTTISADFSKISLKKIDEKTVEFTLPSAYLEFMDSLEFPLLPAHILENISPALVYESNFSSNPVCSGPFVLNAIQAANANEANLQTIYLNRNENYFLKDTMLYSFALKTYENEGDIIAALKAKDVRGTAELGAEDANELPATVGRRTTLVNGGAYAFMNTTGADLSKVKVRKAIQRGVDMTKVRGETMNESQVLDYPILANQMELNYPELPEYDLEAAKQLLVDAGYSYEDEVLVNEEGERVQISLAVAKRDTIAEVAERFAAELKTLGFEVSMSVFDESLMSEDFFATVVRPRDYDILIYEVDLGVSADPFVYYSSTQASGSGWNFSNYSNALVDDALLSAHITTNLATKKTKYETFLKYWVEEAPALGIYRSSMNYYYDEQVRVFADDVVMTDALDRFADVRYWASTKQIVNITP